MKTELYHQRAAVADAVRYISQRREVDGIDFLGVGYARNRVKVSVRASRNS